MRSYYLCKSPCGKTLRALRAIKKGELVISEAGPVSRRQTKHSYQVGWDQHCEPQGPSAYMNHSCQPNIGIKVKPGGQPKFYAIRGIKPGEELVIDYATFEYKTKVLARVKCLCGAPGCRAVITGFVGLKEPHISKYKNHLADYLKQHIAKKRKS